MIMRAEDLVDLVKILLHSGIRYKFMNWISMLTLQEDERLMKDLFTELTAESTPALRRKDLILFLKELCAFAQNLQPQAREIFYKVS